AGGIDLLFDLSAAGLDRAALAAHEAALRARFGGSEHRTTIGAADGAPAATLAAALVEAARRRRGLAIVPGAWAPGRASIAALAAMTKLDPMIGVVQPRFAPSPDRVLVLPGPTAAAAAMSRAALPLLPPTYLTPELPSALLFLSPQGVLAADAPSDGTF